jgi:hypothetical protein
MMACTRILPEAPGIAADGFGGLGADQTDADGGAEQTKRAGDVTGDAGGLSEDFDHGWVGCIVCG